MTKRSEVSVRQWIINYGNGMYDKKDVDTMIEAGWYDWFCKDESLHKKLIKLAPIAMRIAMSPKIDLDNMYMWFKNNCPVNGRLYDDIRFADRTTFDVRYTIIPRSGHRIYNNRAEVWSFVDDKGPNPIATGKLDDVYKFFGV